MTAPKKTHQPLSRAEARARLRAADPGLDLEPVLSSLARGDRGQALRELSAEALAAALSRLLDAQVRQWLREEEQPGGTMDRDAELLSRLSARLLQALASRRGQEARPEAFRSVPRHADIP